MLDSMMRIALEFETATIEALHAPDLLSAAAQERAYVRYADAIEALQGLPDSGSGKAYRYLAQRGRIPDYAYVKILEAMKHFARGQLQTHQAAQLGPH
jgi:hypothetical protein